MLRNVKPQWPLHIQLRYNTCRVRKGGNFQKLWDLIGLCIDLDMGTTTIHLAALGNEAEINEASFPDTVSHSGHCNSGDRSELFVFSAYLRIKTFPLDAGKRLLRDFFAFCAFGCASRGNNRFRDQISCGDFVSGTAGCKRTMERSVAHASPDTRSAFHMSCAI